MDNLKNVTLQTALLQESAVFFAGQWVISRGDPDAIEHCSFYMEVAGCLHLPQCNGKPEVGEPARGRTCSG